MTDWNILFQGRSISEGLIPTYQGVTDHQEFTEDTAPPVFTSITEYPLGPEQATVVLEKQ